MTPLDWLVIGWIALWALLGAARGMTEQVLSLVGLGAGALAGSRAAPLLLPGGRESIWLPLVALGGAAVGAIVVQALLLGLAAPLRRRVARQPLRRVDRGGGVVVGASLGLALAWLIAVVAIYQPGDGTAGLRDQVHRSAILRTALRAVPPDRLLGAIARIDPFPVIPIPAGALPEPDLSVLRSPGGRAAAAAVVRVRGTACGLGKQGSGWVVAEGIVATNAHVVAGQGETDVLVPGRASLPAEPVYVDAGDDVALLRVEGLGVAPLRLGDAPDRAESVVLMGYPGGGPLRAEAATAAPPRTVLAPGASGHGTGPRSVIVTRGSLGPGSSGGPVVDADGTVVAMIFGGSPDGDAGAAVPPAAIRRGLASPLLPVGAGPCA
jgi:uncharacterized membrane protein required for colicin V production